MQVRATKEGYHNHRLRKVGEVFELERIEGLDADRKKKMFTPEMQFADFWMEKVDEDLDEKPSKASIKKSAKSSKEDSVI